jgi:hypothetical protein
VDTFFLAKQLRSVEFILNVRLNGLRSLCMIKIR